MERLRIRVYNVLFGDAILVTIPEEDADGAPLRVNLLIDLGNAAVRGGANEVFDPVVDDILQETGGAPLDLFISTHEHMDHVQGALYAHLQGRGLAARRVWMTASSAPDYYDRHPAAQKKKRLAMTVLEEVQAFVAKSAAPPPAAISSLLAINDTRRIRDCVDHIRAMTERPAYICRGSEPEDHPFRATRFRILAPEEDTSAYYGRLAPRSFGMMTGMAAASDMVAARIVPPAGVSMGDFYDLIRFRASGISANMRSIDKAANDSSVVLELEWRGWRLLFSGDAEEKSWEIMDRTAGLRPVHFLKISHHGSANGSPLAQMELVLPQKPADDRPRFAAVSTANGAYAGVPDAPTLAMLGERAEIRDTRAVQPGGWIDFHFPP